VAYPQLRWRGIALAHFDGRRWSEPERGAQTLSPNNEGWIFVGDGLPRNESHSPSLLYTIYLEPIASDAVFVPGKVVSLRGNFNGESGNLANASRRTYLFRDATGSLFNPFHNYTAVRYEGFSRLPSLDPPKLRAAGTCSFRNSIRVSRRSRNKLRPKPRRLLTKPQRSKLICIINLATR
jgi:hypothetical protein